MPTSPLSFEDERTLQELLSLASSCHTEADCRAAVLKKKTWPVLYHFSPIRQNLIRTLPLKKEDEVLELGADCGAMTGALAEMAGFVTCVESDARRSQILSARHGHQKNVSLLCGTFPQIEGSLASYDWIFLIGSFSTVACEFSKPSCHAALLSRLKAHLKPGGRIVLALENRLGLKYFAGCAEDRTGRFFEGIEGYSRTPEGSMRTFSKDELTAIIEEAGGLSPTFFYPYPDYQFPFSIYSDSYLPRKGDLKNNRNNYDRRRLLLFDEGKVFDSLLQNNLFPRFSNSFLVLLEEEKQPVPTVFAKFSNDRGPSFSIRTEILEDKRGRRMVCKLPATPAAAMHLSWMALRGDYLSEKLSGTRLSYNSCRGHSDGIGFEYLKGETLEEQLLHTLETRGIAACAKEFVDCLNEIKALHAESHFIRTPDFVQVFGDVRVPEGTPCAYMTNIDLLCENLIVEGDRWTAIDYEWIFTFPIPANFLLYRIIMHFTDHANRGEEFKAFDLMGQMGITEGEQFVYAAMEAHFQNYILEGHVPIRSLYPEISQGFIHAESLSPLESLQVYFDFGQGFSEEQSTHYPMYYEGFWRFDRELSLPNGVKALRIDPGSRAAIVRLKKLSFGETNASFALKKGARAGEWLCFPQDDPNLYLFHIPQGATTLRLSLEIHEVDQAAMAGLTPFLKKPSKLPFLMEAIKRCLFKS